MTTPQQADFIFIPLLDGRHALAQIELIHGDHADLLLSRRVARLGTGTALAQDEICARLRVPCAPLTSGVWLIGGYDTLPRLTALPPDTPVLDQAIVEAFASAVHGLFPWDGMGDRALFDAILLDPQDPGITRVFSET